MNRVYSTTEAGKVLGISRIAVFNRIRAGTLEAQRAGRNYVIAHEALERALGQSLSPADRKEIDASVKLAISDFGEAFKKLARE